MATRSIRNRAVARRGIRCRVADGNGVGPAPRTGTQRQAFDAGTASFRQGEATCGKSVVHLDPIRAIGQVGRDNDGQRRAVAAGAHFPGNGRIHGQDLSSDVPGKAHRTAAGAVTVKGQPEINALTTGPSVFVAGRSANPGASAGRAITDRPP
jgi:hypothetical protein